MIQISERVFFALENNLPGSYDIVEIEKISIAIRKSKKTAFLRLVLPPTHAFGLFFQLKLCEILI